MLYFVLSKKKTLFHEYDTTLLKKLEYQMSSNKRLPLVDWYI